MRNGLKQKKYHKIFEEQLFTEQEYNNRQICFVKDIWE